MATATPRPSASTPKQAAAPKQAGATGHGGQSTTGHSAGQSTGGGKASTSDTLAALVKALDDVELADQHDLNTFCEAGRKLGHYLAVVTSLAAGELEAGAKEMAKNQHAGWGTGFKIKRVTRRLNNAGDHFGSAAADFVGAWTTFEQVFADLLDKSATKTKTHKRFTIS